MSKMLMSKLHVEAIDACRYRIPIQGKMRVEGRVYANEKLMASLRQDQALQQVANVATLPGIKGYSLAMPDIHWGYGFPIGGVAAFDVREGVVSPGGVGYDINCGVRLLKTPWLRKELLPKIHSVVADLFRRVPTGVGAGRQDLKLSHKDYPSLLTRGAKWALKRGLGLDRDLAYIEKGGVMAGADPDKVSERAKLRGANQLGSLGSGNHFLELQFVDEIFDAQAARALGLFEEQVTVSIHTGSRGLGHQVCDDHLQSMLGAARKYGIDLPDRQLCCAPIGSKEGQAYLAAMAAAANFAFANRQIITHDVRTVLSQALGGELEDVELVYDLCHNIATFEEHWLDERTQKLCVHRKGATRAFPPHHQDTPDAYAKIGQPVLIPGDMGRYSYVLVGTQQAYFESFASTCHGAGRLLSRTQSRNLCAGQDIVRQLQDQGVVVQAAGLRSLAEEMPQAYKDVADVVAVVEQAGLSKKVAKLVPLGVIKG